MRFNLENFPRFKGDIKEYLEEVIPWKIGFEKEVRESLTWLQTQWHPRSDVEKAKRQAMIEVNEAVLGESCRFKPKIKEEIEK